MRWLGPASSRWLLAPEGIDQVELTEPWKAVQDAGGTPKLLSIDSGEVQAYSPRGTAGERPADVTVHCESRSYHWP